VEFDPVLHEPDVPAHGECPADAQVVFLGDNDAFHALAGFEQGVLDVAHVPLDLPDDGVASSPPLQLDDQEPAFWTTKGRVSWQG
jgi:hypothetical protein